ncbi:MAG: FtsX-like permease family protein, partial [Pseudohongiellaceae bacterium]
NSPANSHLVSNLFINIDNVTGLFQSPNFWDNIGSDIMYHYLLLAPGAEPEAVSAAMLDYMAQLSPIPGEFAAQVDVRLQSLRDIHFTTDLQNEMTVRDDITGVVKPHRQWSDLYLFVGVAVLTLTIAVFNFMNLQLAMASLRARELGVRRTLGASRLDLVIQFLVETLFMCALALVLALALAQLLLPYFNTMVAAPLSLVSLLSPANMLVVAAALLALALVAGSYPAWLMAGLSPVLALRGQVSAGLSAEGLRSGLVMLQFAISIAMIIAACVVNSQLNYAMTKSLGFDPNNVLVVDLGVPEARRAFATLRSELLGQASIESVSAGSILPTQSLSDGAILNRTTEAGLREITTRRVSVSDDYFQTLGMEFAAGRALTSGRPGDFMASIGPDNLEVSGGVIFNETAARAGGWEDPEDAIGQSLFSEFSFGGNDYRMNFTVVGVVQDAHYGSVRNDIGPISYALDSNRSSMVVRARDGSLPQAMAAVERIWQQAVPDFPLRSLQLREEYAALYASENRTFILFMGLSAIAIIMASFGLYGLASLIAETRRKEISIRKVLGATVRQLMMMLSWRIVRLVLIANLVAWPLAWWVMQNWLTNFAYRTSMDIGLFVFASLMTLMIALLTIGHRAWTTAIQSPVHALRAE